MPVVLLASAAAKTVPDISIGHALLQMVLGLAVIVASIVLLTKFLARLRAGSPRSPKRASTEGLTILSRQSLGKDLAIATVRWSGREVLVGISGSTITFLNDARADDTKTGGEQPAELALGTDDLGGARLRSLSPALLASAVARRGGMEQTTGRPVARASLLETLRDATARR